MRKIFPKLHLRDVWFVKRSVLCEAYPAGIMFKAWNKPSRHLIVQSQQWIEQKKILRSTMDKPDSAVVLFFCLTVPRPILRHSQGDSLTNPMFITVIVKLWPQGQRESLKRQVKFVGNPKRILSSFSYSFSHSNAQRLTIKAFVKVSLV